MLTRNWSFFLPQEFAKKNNRPTFDLLISPRVRGLEACLEGLRGAKPEILDCTISYQSYTGEIPTWDMGMCVCVCEHLLAASATGCLSFLSLHVLAFLIFSPPSRDLSSSLGISVLPREAGLILIRTLADRSKIPSQATRATLTRTYPRC